MSMHVSLNHHSNTDGVPIQMTEAISGLFSTINHRKSWPVPASFMVC